VSIDSIGVAGTLVQPVTTYEETSTLIACTGVWTTFSNAGYSGGTLKVAHGTGTAFTVNFTGTSIGWTALTGPTYGIASVTLDGVVQQYLDLYSATYLSRQLVFSRVGLPSGPHTLVVRWTGLKNASATSDYISLDAIGVTGTLTQAP